MIGGKLQEFHNEEMLVDQIIYQALEKGISLNSQITDENKDDENVKKIQEEFARRKKMILLLFDGEFSENEQLVKKRHTPPRKPGFISDIVNRILEKQVDEIFDEVFKVIPENSFEATVGWERKYFLDSIIEQNWEFDLDELKSKEDEAR